MKKRWFRIILALCLLIALALQAGASEASALAGLLDTTPEELLRSELLTPGESQSDWVALLAGRWGETADREVYLNGLWDFVSEQYVSSGGLDRVKATVWHRISLTVLALGADPTCFGTDAYGEPIDLIADGTYHWHMTDSLGTQGLNGWIFALLTLDAGAYAVPAGATYTREDMVAAILSAQEPDGGFGLSAGKSDVDITAMALQALAPYRQEHPQAIARALKYLSAAQTARGDFENWDSTSAESSAQVIIALCALGIDPRSDAAFVKDGGSALDGLLLYQTADGAFCHTLDASADLLATEQACLALCALERMDAGKGSLYDFSDTEIRAFSAGQGKTVINPLWYILGGAGVLICLCFIILLVRKGKNHV